MFVFYQHHKDARGKVVLTELKLSSSNKRWSINFSDSKEQLLFNLCKPVLTSPPVAYRMYENATKMWTYMEEYGVQVITKIETVTSVMGGATLLAVEDLASLASQYSFDVSSQKAQRPEDFFYTHGQIQATLAITKELALTKLAALTGFGEDELRNADSVVLKSIYRRTALKLHPDRNGGNGYAMSDLNMYWGIYNA